MMERIHTVLIKPSSGTCNMKCDYCFYCDEAAKRKTASYGFMSEDTVKNIIKKVLFQAAGDVCFAFQGGEPLLRGLPFFEKVIEFQTMYNRNNVKILNTIQTNGLDINEEWCRFFYEHNILTGISVDGIRETHDVYRHGQNGSPTYERVRNSIRLMQDHQAEFNILTVVNQRTAAEIGQIYREYKRNGWNYQQYITCLDPLGEEQGQEEYSLTPQAYGEFLCKLFDLWYKDWRRDKSPYIRQFENYVGILMGHPPEACEQRGFCSVQTVIEADGSVYPCDFYVLDQYRLGNFNENKVGDILDNETAREFVEASRHISSRCKACPYYTLCRGGCRRSRIPDDGEGGERSYFCEGYRMFFERSYKRMEEMAGYLSGAKRQDRKR